MFVSKELSESLGAIRARLSRVKHPVLLVLIVGLVARLLMASFSMGFDADYWAVVIRNIEAGDGLYGAEGYYYTPVWGYILGVIAAFQSLFLNLGDVAVRVVEAFPAELVSAQQTATVTSLALNYSIRIPLMIFDLITALLVMHLVRDISGDRERSVLAFALAFLSPVVIGSTCVIGMPDTISTMFAVLAVVLVRRNHCLLAGMVFCLAALTKFFPAFLIFVLVAYLLVRHRDDPHRGYPQLALAILGAATTAAVIFMPQILQGDLSQCFQFLTDRAGGSSESSIIGSIMGLSSIAVYVLALIISFIAGLMVYRAPEGELDHRLMKGCLLVAVSVLLYPPTTQYIVFLIPFLAYWISVEDRRLMLSWKILAVGSMIYMFSSNSLTMMSMAVWGGIPDVSAVLDFFYAYSSGWGMLTPMGVQFAIGGVLQCLGIFSVLLFMYGDRIRAGPRHNAEST